MDVKIVSETVWETEYTHKYKESSHKLLANCKQKNIPFK